MPAPFSVKRLLIIIIIISLLLAIIQIGALSLAFDKLGLSRESAMLLLFSSLIGSAINLPLFKVQSTRSEPMPIPPWLKSLLPPSRLEFKGVTLIAVNVGGGLLPLGFTFYLINYSVIPLATIVLASGIMAAICYYFSRPLPGIGIGMPIFIAPLCAAILGMLLSPENSPALAYICGTLGVLIGADLLRLKDVKNMGSPVASIGGAGTFDGIFITGIVAVLLA